MKGKLFLIHWHAEEADAHAEMLQRTGWEVGVEYEDGARAVREIKNKAPNAVIIYLTRLASDGRQTAAHLRHSATTREVPIIFVGGTAEVIKQTQMKVPDGVFISAEALHKSLEGILNG